MKIIDPHVDIADICKAFHISIDEFITGKIDAPVDLPKIISSGIEFIGSTLYFDESYVKTNFYDGVKSYLQFYHKIFSKTGKVKELKSIADLDSKKSDQVGFFYSVEGFECLRSPEDFYELYDLGVRIWGPAWAHNNQYASSRQDTNDRGFTDQGKSLLKMMSEKKVTIDTAHLSQNSFKDLEKNFDGLIINTHSNSLSVHPKSNHNLNDYEISVIAERGGVIGLFLLSEDIGTSGDFEELFKHFEYVANKWGLEHIAFCSDIFPLAEYPFVNNAQDITIMRDLQDFLLTRLAEKEVSQVMYDNFLRILRSTL